MKRHFAMLQATLATSLLLVLTIPSVQAQAPAGPKRPARVPEGYVITPFGYFHPSCVREVASQDTVLADGRLKHADGKIDAQAPACNYPHYTARGETVDGKVIEPSIGHSWIVSSNAIDTISPFSGLTGNWIVPPAPTSDDGQTVFLFTGLEDYSADQSILQPVLGWNAGVYGKSWTIASWNCCLSGTADHSAFVQVNPGDTISGMILPSSSTETNGNTSWNIFTMDVTTGQSVMLLNTPSDGQTFTWAQGGVLEVYNIAQCSDYPPNGSVVFSNLALYENNLTIYSNPGWFLFNYTSGLTPQCNYGATMGSNTVTLTY
jgi:hypothetical protein